MYSIFKKEIHSFFSSLVGYVAIIVFLIVIGLFMWVLPDMNLLDYGYASLDKFFSFAPWILLFLVPAITMRMFPDEYKSGTIEILLTQPLKINAIVLGKYLASLALIAIALAPTLLYVFTINHLSELSNNIDRGAIAGSYFGLLFMTSAFAAIGVFSSSITSNQIVGFLFALFLCYFFYSGFEAISAIPAFEGGVDYVLSMVGMESHYKSISRGVLDTRDLVYFISITVIFLAATKLMIESRKWEKK